MTKKETEIFESVLKSAGLEFTQKEGLYKIHHSDGDEFVQTSGYNLLYSLKRLISSSAVEEILC